MVRPFLILTFWAYVWGFFPKVSLDDYRAPIAMLLVCSLATAATEWIIRKINTPPRT